MHVYNSPRGVGLPMTRNMPFHTASVPHRSRNMTGIYLGLEGNSKPPRSKSAIPPLARGRGMSFKVRTPAEDRRYKMVEGLRIKEEKRGFTGGALRNCKSASTTAQEQRQSQRNDRRKWGPARRIDPNNIDDLIRPNPRNFTPVANSGVTRSERLVGWAPHPDPYMLIPDPYTVTPSDLVADEVAEEVHKLASSNDELAGLEECYRRICKVEAHPRPRGRLESLHSLLPSRRAQPNHYRRDNVGFTVRSYRNPAQAEILAEFPDPLQPGRPKTVPIQRPLVPSPYFFRHNAPGSGTGPQGKGVVPGQFEDAPDCLIVPRVLAAPGAGGISRTLQYRTSPLLGSLQLLTGKEYMSHLPDTARSADNLPGDRTSAPLAQPSLTDLESRAPEGEGQRGEGEKVATDTSREPVSEQEGINMNQVIIAGEEEDHELEDAGVGGVRPRPRLTTSNSGADIMLGLETDEGKSAEVEIDSLESDELQPEVFLEIPKGRVRKTSIVEKLSKSKESEMIALSIMENAGQRQREFEKLISEHQELVQEISRTPSAENIVQTETGRDP
ncbi:uncharacterized protein LOC101859859 [Aplysia californica]|uniref:Uncharacterized protein LOC101859859 n=1 Tax=Aplysia californica TaxID=6500 RepID=A0ABM1A0R2_APLCA|nr:uncharacterized protein LOC101859859 [Aplysia californica]